MKPKDSKNRDKKKYTPGHENQNIRDFNPSQYVEEEVEVEKKKAEEEGKSEKNDKPKDKKKYK